MRDVSDFLKELNFSSGLVNKITKLDHVYNEIRNGNIHIFKEAGNRPSGRKPNGLMIMNLSSLS